MSARSRWPRAVYGVGGAIPLALWVLVASARRYRTAQCALHARSALPDARLPVAVTLLILLIGLAELAYVLG